MESRIAQAIGLKHHPVAPIWSDEKPAVAVPRSLFNEMEVNVTGSFLERPTWQSLMKEKQGDSLGKDRIRCIR